MTIKIKYKDLGSCPLNDQTKKSDISIIFKSYMSNFKSPTKPLQNYRNSLSKISDDYKSVIVENFDV